MQVLPPECQHHILLYLAPEDLGNFSMVSRSWQASTGGNEFLWKKIYQQCFRDKVPEESTWRKACSKAFAELYAAIKTGETVMAEPLNRMRYKRLADFIMGYNYSQEEIQALSRISTLSTLVDCVAKSGHYAVLKRLARHLEPRTFKSLIPQAFLQSSTGGHLLQMDWLMLRDPTLDVNHVFQTSPGQYTTALLAAVNANSLETTRFLLNKGAKLQVSHREPARGVGRRAWKLVFVPDAVSHAITQGFTELTKAIVTFYLDNMKGSKTDKTRTMQEYLNEAVRHNRAEIVEFLLAQKDYCDVNGVTGLSASDGVSVALVPPMNESDSGMLRLSQVGPAIFQAAMQGNVDLAKLLISKGANVDQQTAQRRTALHISTYYGQTHFVNFLLEKGVPLDTKTTDGATALSIALCKGHKAVIEVFERELVKRKGKG